MPGRTGARLGAPRGRPAVEGCSCPCSFGRGLAETLPQLPQRSSPHGNQALGLQDDDRDDADEREEQSVGVKRERQTGVEDIDEDAEYESAEGRAWKAAETADYAADEGDEERALPNVRCDLAVP